MKLPNAIIITVTRAEVTMYPSTRVYQRRMIDGDLQTGAPDTLETIKMGVLAHPQFHA